MSLYEEVEQLSEQIREFADIEGTEAGEYWNMIADLNSHYYVMSDGFHESLKKELEYQLKYIAENYKIIEEESVEIGKYKALEFIG